MPDPETAAADFLAAHPDVELFEVILADLAGGLRGKWITRDKIRSVLAGDLKLPLSSVVFDSWGRDVEEWVFSSGDGDGICVADPRSLAPVPWAAGSRARAKVATRVSKAATGMAWLGIHCTINPPGRRARRASA